MFSSIRCQWPLLRGVGREMMGQRGAAEAEGEEEEEEEEEMGARGMAE